MIRRSAYLLLSILLWTCDSANSPDCSLVLCATNESIQLEILQNGVNILASGEITTEDVLVTSSNGEEFRFDVFNSTQGAAEALLSISQFGQGSGSYTYSIDIESTITFDIQVIYSLSERGPCCGERLLIQQLNSNDVEISELSGFFRVQLD